MIDMVSELIRIRGLRDQFVPATQTAIMDRAIDELIASGIRDSSLKPGDRMPDFSLSDSAGKQIHSRDLLKSGPAVLSFYRGNWCPYCQIELRALEQALPDIERRGASLVAVSPELPDRQVATQKENALTFPVLYDPGNTVAKLFGIVYALPVDLLQVYRERGHDLGTVNGPAGADTLALPATFVIDRSATIRLAFIDEDYARRLSTDEILNALDAL